jgi:AcrR family transcriptional regulator
LIRGSVLGLSVPQNIAALSREQRILDAMAETVAEKTFAATTIGDIARRAGVSRATFYKHFPNKRACFVAAVDAFVAELTTVAAGAHTKVDPPPEAVRRACAAILATLAARTAYAKMALVEALAVDPAIVDRYRRVLIRSLAAQWGQGELTPDAEAEARLAFGRAQVLMLDRIAADEIAQLPELCADLVYIALLPFVGPEEAMKEASLAR